MSPPLLVIVGPTASGKSTLAARLGARLSGEVISADSVQVYRHFDLGAGKPGAAELALCPHHLLDIREPDDALDASQWANLADAVIASIQGRGKRAIVCGGTFLWIRALLHGLAEAPPGDEALRQAHRELAEREGRPALHAQLATVDPAAAARLHPNDLVRVSRALEIHQLLGKPMSEIHASHGFREARYEYQLLGIDWPRDEYDARVRERVETMLEAGFREEVRRLALQGYAESRAMRSVGYRQVYAAMQAGQRDDPALIDEITRVTRVFARRQRTWLRDEDARWVSPAVLDDDAAFQELAQSL